MTRPAKELKETPIQLKRAQEFVQERDGMTLEELAKRTGISRPVLAGYVREPQKMKNASYPYVKKLVDMYYSSHKDDNLETVMKVYAILRNEAEKDNDESIKNLADKVLANPEVVGKILDDAL